MGPRTATWLCFAACACAAASAHAESSQGGAFRLPGYGARAWGMAGAVVATVDDESAVSWNPARLPLAARSVGASYVNLVPGAVARQSQVVFVTPLVLGAEGHAGVSTHAAGAMVTNLYLEIAGGESYAENHLRVAYAYSPEPFVTFAIAGDLFLSTSGVPGFDAWGTGVDFAGRLALSNLWDLGFVAHDAFSRYTYDDGRDDTKERQFVLGASYRGVPHARVETDAVRERGSWSRVLMGVESDYLFGHVALRAGVALHTAGDTRAVPGLGVSARAGGRFSMHYGATLDDEEALGVAHRVSLAALL